MCWKFQGTKPNLERGARVYWTYYYLKTASWASLAKRFGKTAAYLNQLAFHWAQKNNKPWPPVDADDQRVKYYKTSYRENMPEKLEGAPSPHDLFDDFIEIAPATETMDWPS